MSSDIYASKVSIKKFLEKLLETYVSKTSRKKSLCKQKLLKKTFETCASKKNPLKLMQGRNSKKKNPLKLVQGKISGILRKM
jgi:hypothetical protein